MLLIILLFFTYKIKTNISYYIRNKKFKIFTFFKGYYLKKSIRFFIWKEMSLGLLMLQLTNRKYIIIITLLNFISMLFGFLFFYENLYDYFFLNNFNNLTKEEIAILEPPFDTYNPEISPQENSKYKIQKDKMFYNFIFITTCIYLASIFYMQ